MSDELAGFDSNAHAAVKYAEEEAGTENMGFIGTEHLLIGVARADGSLGSQALTAMGISAQQLRDEVVMQSMRTQRIILSDLMATSRADAVVKRAREIANDGGSSTTGTEHLMLAMLGDPECVACRVLTDLGVSVESVISEVSKLTA